MYLGRLECGRVVGITLQRITRLVRVRPYACGQATGIRDLNHSCTTERPQSYRAGDDRAPYWSEWASKFHRGDNSILFKKKSKRARYSEAISTLGGGGEIPSYVDTFMLAQIELAHYK